MPSGLVSDCSGALSRRSTARQAIAPLRRRHALDLRPAWRTRSYLALGFSIHRPCTPSASRYLPRLWIERPASPRGGTRYHARGKRHGTEPDEASNGYRPTVASARPVRGRALSRPPAPPRHLGLTRCGGVVGSVVVPRNPDAGANGDTTGGSGGPDDDAPLPAAAGRRGPHC